MKTPRVAIVAHRFVCPGGIQTCFMELIGGLNEKGIVPEIVWDESTDWDVLGNPRLQVTYGGGRLGISSAKLRSLPSWLFSLLRPLSVRTASLGLDRYDFVYGFEPGVRMPAEVPNLCYVCGPPFLRIPGESPDLSRLSVAELRKLLQIVTMPTIRPDPHSRYVTLSEWIAELWLKKFGFRPKVIWPPMRSRLSPAAASNRSGFLFLSRIQESKHAESMLTIARAYPGQKVTIAGVVLDSKRPYVARLREYIHQQGLSNAEVIENPTEQAVSELFARHAFFVFSAPWEHFGIVTVEAIQAGLLPLVHDTGGQREIVPIDSLRFLSDDELVTRAGDMLQIPIDERQCLIGELSRHVQQGSPERYREAMLRSLRLDHEAL